MKKLRSASPADGSEDRDYPLPPPLSEQEERALQRLLAQKMLSDPRIRARETVLTEEIEETICSAIRANMYLDQACALAGVFVEDVRAWMATAGKARARIVALKEAVRRERREPTPAERKKMRLTIREQRLVRFQMAVEHSTATAEMRNVISIQKAGQEGNWTASAYLLARQHPSRWGQRREMEAAPESAAASVGFAYVEVAGKQPAADADQADGEKQPTDSEADIDVGDAGFIN